MRKEKEMHALVFCLFKEMVNPPMVVLNLPQTSEMALHASDHSWDGSDCLKEDDSVEPSLLLHGVRVVKRRCVHEFSASNH